MSDFPVLVTRTPDGTYSAVLCDIPEGPSGNGVDPYAAFDDLEEKAVPFLLDLSDKGALPTPSAADDRPVISLDTRQVPAETVAGDLNASLLPRKNSIMLCYSWTNTVLLQSEME